MQNAIDINQLITRYVEAAGKALKALRAKAGCDDVFAAWRSGAIPAAGGVELLTGGEGTYLFHGRGCYFEIGSLKIDLEFSQSDAIGFDAWRLYRFADETLGIEGIEPEEIDLQLKEKVDAGALRRSEVGLDKGLFFVVGDVPTQRSNE